LHLPHCLRAATIGTGPLEALVCVIARPFELLQTISTRELRAIRLCAVEREALTPIAGLGFELFNEPIGHLMISGAQRATCFLSGRISLCRLIT